MTIIRSPRPENNYTVIQNVVFNSNLSYRAMGLLTMLLSKPDNWEVSVAHLVNVVAATAKPDGRDAIYMILSELIEVGFMKRTMERDERGKAVGYRYEVFDCPFTPFPDKPFTAEPDTANPTLTSTDLKQDLRNKQSPQSESDEAVTSELFDEQTKDAKKSTKKSSGVPTPADLLKDLPDDLARDFIQHRKTLKAPITQTAVEGIRREAKKASLSFEEAVRHIVERGWRGFKAEWVTKDQPVTAQTQKIMGSGLPRMQA